MFLVSLVDRGKMQKDTGSGPSTSSGPTARLRRRRGSNEVPPEVDKGNGSHLLVNDHNKYKSMITRAYSSVWMIGGFALIIYMGHLYIWAMVVVIQIFMAKELFSLLRKTHEDSHLPGFRHLNWHFFFTAMLFVYGRILSQRLVNTVGADGWFYVVHSFTEEEDVQVSIWPICVDAYDFDCGVYADLSTGWLHCDPGSLFKPEYFTVPEWFPEWDSVLCAPKLPVLQSSKLSALVIISSTVLHFLAVSLERDFYFACAVACVVSGSLRINYSTFGGFFASGFKRAFKIKDFGDSIPGHGGITDRMDCQMVMAVFAYIYHQSFVVPQSLSIEMIMDQILVNLPFEDQRALYMKLGQIIMERQFGES
ncbi:hypothetical protein DH2020_027356 [Rehmannia glutinosa]|uniref:Phosphatidate cytidylyltransferase n=1 Tax=Rehmannia glutinosa TaxID=99300 RepID=A0ABR0VYH9_REHGL